MSTEQLGRQYSAGCTSPDEPHDAFIAYVGKDAGTLVEPLSHALVERGWSIRLDELEPVGNTTLNEHLDASLMHCRFGMVVLSPAFFATTWSKHRLAALVSHELDPAWKVILPIWHEMEREDLPQDISFPQDYPTARARIGIESLAEEISSALECAGVRCLAGSPPERPAERKRGVHRFAKSSAAPIAVCVDVGLPIHAAFMARVRQRAGGIPVVVVSKDDPAVMPPSLSGAIGIGQWANHEYCAARDIPVRMIMLLSESQYLDAFDIDRSLPGYVSLRWKTEWTVAVDDFIEGLTRDLRMQQQAYVREMLAPGDAGTPTLWAEEIAGRSGARYAFERVVGVGGTAIVATVRDEAGSVYAAKTLSGHRFPIDSTRERFSRECGLLAKVSHPNVIRFVDQADMNDMPVLLMEYLADGSLHQHLSRHGQPDANTALKWLNDVLSGLGALHDSGIVHRDITPKNLLFGAGGGLVVADFGTVRHLDDATLTASAERIGSLIYIPHEQFESPHAAGTAADVYAVGQIGFRLLTGIVPHGNAGQIRDHAPDVRAEVADAIEAMRAFRPGDRPVDALDALRLLRTVRATQESRPKDGRGGGRSASGNFIDTSLDLLGRARDRDEVLRCIESRRLIPARFLYASDDGADNWIGFCKDPSSRFYLQELDVWAGPTGEAIADLIRSELGRGDLNYVSLGCGDGQKDAYLIDHWLRDGAGVAYYPYDISMALLSRASRWVLDRSRPPTSDGLHIKAFLADFDGLAVAGDVFRQRSCPNVISLLGNGLGDVENEPRLMRAVRDAMSDEDLLLLEVRLDTGYDVYDPPSLAEQRFYFGALQMLNVPFHPTMMTFLVERDVSMIPETLTYVTRYQRLQVGGVTYTDVPCARAHCYKKSKLLDAVQRAGLRVLHTTIGGEEEGSLVCVARRED